MSLYVCVRVWVYARGGGLCVCLHKENFFLKFTLKILLIVGQHSISTNFTGRHYNKFYYALQ